MWIYVFIGALTVSASLAAEDSKKNETEVTPAAKDKRQIDRDTVVIGGARSYNPYSTAHLYPQPQEAQDIPNYVTPIPRQGKAQHYRAPPQQQISELPQEYVKLLQEISLQQQYQQQQGRLQGSKPRRVQPQQPRPSELQYVNAPQPAPKQEQNVQYISEEEYAKLLENQKAYQAQAQAQAAQQSEGLSNYRSPSGAKIPAPQQHPQALVRYHRPLTDFDKELAQLVESNKPINYQLGTGQSFGAPQPQPRPGPKHHRPSPHQEQRYVSATNEPVYIQPQQRIKYVNPANIQYIQKPQLQKQQQQSHHEVPAQRYQFISSPQFAHHQQIQAGQPQPQQSQQQDLSQIQYYIPREKEITSQQQFKSAQQPHVIYDTQGVMKVVDPPQLQYAQPEAQKLVAEQQVQSQQVQHQKYHTSKKQSQKEGGQQSGGSHKSSTPSRSAIYVSRTTGGPPVPKNDKPELPPLKLNQDRPLTQAEFQALVDQGYNLVPIPVPVPYPVSYDPSQQQPAAEEKPAAAQDPQTQQSQTRYASQTVRPRHHAPAYRYGQQASASQQRPVTYLQPISQDEAYTGVRGPNAATA